MKHKDFDLIAYALNKAAVEDITAQIVADVLADTYPHFNSEIFMKRFRRFDWRNEHLRPIAPGELVRVDRHSAEVIDATERVR